MKMKWRAEEIFLFLFIFFLPWMHESGIGVIELGFTIYPNYIFVALAGIFLVIRRIREGNWRFWGTPLDLVFVFFLYVLMLSIAQTNFIRDISKVTMATSVSIFSRTPILKNITQVCAMFFMVFIYYIIINIVRNEEVFKRAILVFFVSSCLMCLYGLITYGLYHLKFLGAFEGLKRISGWNPLSLEYRGVRIRTFFSEPLIFGVYLVSILPLSISMLFQRFKPHKGWLWLIITLQMITLCLTLSGGAYLGFGLALFILIIANRKELHYRKAFHSGLLFIISVLFIIISFGFGDKIRQEIKKIFSEQYSTAMVVEKVLSANKAEPTSSLTMHQWGALARVNSMVAAWRMFRDHPILGVGWGNYIFDFLTYDPVLVQWEWSATRPVVPTANNLFVSVAAETGILGLISLGLLIGITIKSAIKTLSIIRGTNWHPIFSGYLASFIAVFVVCYNFFSVFYLSFVWAMLGMMMAARKIALEKSSANNRK